MIEYIPQLLDISFEHVLWCGYMCICKCNQLYAGMWQVSTVLFLVSRDSFSPLKEHSSGSSDKYSSGASAMALSSYSYAGFNSVSLTALLLASQSQLFHSFHSAINCRQFSMPKIY